MNIMRAVLLSARAVVLAACVAGHVSTAAGQAGISASRKLEAAYSITFARISVGAATLSAEFRENEYAATATGHAGGVMKILLNGSASLSTRGFLRDGRLVPTSFTSKVESETEIDNVRMALDDGRVKELEASPPTDVGAIPEEERQGIIDPLTAMLAPSAGSDSAGSQEVCRRTLRVFDGRNRYDLKSAFKRMDELSDDRGYKGPVVICALSYVAVAGYGVGAPLAKYLSAGREMEVALAPVPGTPVLAPVRLFVASMVANLVITTTRFEASVQSDPARAGSSDRTAK